MWLRRVQEGPCNDAKSSEAWDGLAALYNSTSKFDLAADAAGKAMALQAASGGGDATSAYNNGAIMMNSGKIAEAKAQFQRAIQLDPRWPKRISSWA